jgi:hypothetical protein
MKPIIFTVRFREHLSSEKVSNLIGILGFKGVVRDQGRDWAVIEVSRAPRVPAIARTLRNWDGLGWLTWEADGDISN